MRRTEAERVRYVEVFSRSGLRPVEFCSEYGLNAKTFYAWRKRYSGNGVGIRGNSSSKSKSDLLGKASFLSVHIKEDETPSDGLAKPPMLLTFKTKSFCLEVALNEQPNGDELRLIVQTLHDLD